MYDILSLLCLLSAAIVFFFSLFVFLKNPKNWLHFSFLLALVCLSLLEFGYFVGFLSRKKVFCLYRGDIDLPSDMRGILHAQFKKSVKEAKEDIVRELKGAHYDLHIQKTE